jgi:hypothetical protein
MRFAYSALKATLSISSLRSAGLGQAHLLRALLDAGAAYIANADCGLRGCADGRPDDRDWCAMKGQKAKQSYAIAMKDCAPFGVAGAGPFPCRWPVLIFVVARFEPDLLSAWM